MKYTNKDSSFLLKTAGISYLQTKVFTEFSPSIKLILGLSSGVWLNQNKNHRLAEWGNSLITGSIISYSLNTLNQNNCSFTYQKFLPKPNSILVNVNTGRVIETVGKPFWIFVTEKTNSTSGWQNSSPLYYCIKELKGKGGGHPSKKGEPVLWNSLQDHTLKFNSLLKYWTNYFSGIKANYENRMFSKWKYWVSMVDDNKPLDIKRKSFRPSLIGEWSIYNKTIMRYDDYGNMLYGAAGTAFGFSEKVLLFGANLNQLSKSGLDESKDTYAIRRGIAIYKKHLSNNNL